MMTDLDRDTAALARAARDVTVRVFDGTRGMGAGVVWGANGEIVTNAHVVRGPSARVEWHDGCDARASVVRRDDGADLALLRLDAGVPKGRAVARVRRDDPVRPGDVAVAVGHPRGLAWAFAAGLVRGCNARWVMTSVRLEPGNSGGPLLDVAGRVVGINSMVAGDVGLAIPSDLAAAFVDGARAPRLGIGVARAVATHGGRRIPALVVTAIEPDGTAARSGLAFGDAIVAVEGAALGDLTDVVAALAGARTLGILRAGERATIALDHRGNARAA